MPHPVALAVVAGLLVVTVVVGLLLRRRSGRVSEVFVEEPADPADFGLPRFGSAGSIVQFSTEYCARCPGVRRQIAELLRDQGALDFVHVDVTNTPEISKKYRLLQTPTVLFIDSEGRPRTRLSGPLSRDTLDSAITRFTEGAPL